MGTTRVLIAGGGVAAVETLLGLRALAGERVEMELLSDSSELVNRPSSVTQAFGRTSPRRVDIARIAADCGARLRHGSLDGVDLECNEALTRGHERIRYDVLVVGIGARVHDPLPGALSFRGPESAPTFRGLLRDLHLGSRRDVVFTIPIGTSWPLPLYELALLTAARVRAAGIPNVRLALATPEDRPLHVFGGPASEAVTDLLQQAGVELVTGVFPVAVEPGRLRVSSDRTLPADRVVTLPQLRGPSLLGLPHDGRGFLETDLHGLVRGTKDVYAAGDVTDFAIKHGGLAAQQADAVAEAIAARAGADVDPLPFRPVLRGLLLAGTARRYLTADLVRGQDETSKVEEIPLWWPPTKVAARHLGNYLVGASDQVPQDAPDDPEAIPVEVRAEAPTTGVS
jgi:sulfide:quinone oxidoreductase